MRAEILSIGTELLLGDIVNTNAMYLSKRLAEMGVYVYFQTVVGDNPERILEAYAIAYQRADLIIISGGLGPTEDDVTKETAARYFGREMVFHPGIWDPIALYYEKRGAEPIESAMKQAVFPEGSEILSNPGGTAPGCWIHDGKKMMAMMPGPPREMVPMFEEQVVPRIRPYMEQTFKSHTLRVCGAGESNVEEALRELIHLQGNPTIATYAKEGEVHVRITARAGTDLAAAQLLDPVVKASREKLGGLVYGESEDTLEETLYKLLKEKKLTISVAESITGGLICGRLVNVPGMSQCLVEGQIAYTNQAKIRQLKIRPDRLEEFGPVSAEIASDMAWGSAAVSGADIGLSVTGWAGPDDDPKVQTGIVWMGMHMNGKSSVKKIAFSGDRNRIRFFAANMSLCWLLGVLKDRL